MRFELIEEKNWRLILHSSDSETAEKKNKILSQYIFGFNEFILVLFLKIYITRKKVIKCPKIRPMGQILPFVMYSTVKSKSIQRKSRNASIVCIIIHRESYLTCI